MMSDGTVRQWDDDEGFGVIDSPGTTGGCWAHFSSIVKDGYRALVAGDQVAFTCEAARQDGYDYRAVLVWPPGVEPGTPPSSSSSYEATDGEVGTAYQSTLTIRWDDGTVSRRPGQPGTTEPPEPPELPGGWFR